MVTFARERELLAGYPERVAQSFREAHADDSLVRERSSGGGLADRTGFGPPPDEATVRAILGATASRGVSTGAGGLETVGLAPL